MPHFILHRRRMTASLALRRPPRCLKPAPARVYLGPDAGAHAAQHGLGKLPMVSNLYVLPPRALTRRGAA